MGAKRWQAVRDQRRLCRCEDRFIKFPASHFLSLCSKAKDATFPDRCFLTCEMGVMLPKSKTFEGWEVIYKMFRRERRKLSFYGEELSNLLYNMFQNLSKNKL